MKIYTYCENCSRAGRLVLRRELDERPDNEPSGDWDEWSGTASEAGKELRALLRVVSFGAHGEFVRRRAFEIAKAAYAEEGDTRLYTFYDTGRFSWNFWRALQVYLAIRKA